MNLERIYNLCTQLQYISSTKEKEKFLVDNRCEEFDEFLKWLLDPQIVTGVDKKKLNKNVEGISIGEPYATIDNVLKYLITHNTGSDKDVAYCQLCLKTYPEYKDFLTDVFTKRLKLGVNLKTVAKAYGKDFIHVHEVQLGSGRDKLRLKDGELFNLTHKLNGQRNTYVDGHMISRQGKEYLGLDHIVEQIKLLNSNNNFVLDGELIRRNIDNCSDNENFRKTTSIINSDNPNKQGIDFVLFDILPLDEFKKGKSKAKYFERRDMLEKYVAEAQNLFGENCYIKIAKEFYRGDDQNKIEECLKIVDDMGLEGLMLAKDAPYEAKRVTSLIKIKTFKFSDVKVIGYQEGEGKYAGKLGAVIVDYKGTPVNVGSGFDDADRVELWKNPENLIGRILEVKYKEESMNEKTGKVSIQFPVFSQWRPDKESVSYE